MERKVTPSQLVEIAVKLEEAGSDFYSDIAKISSENRSLFEELSRVEAKHAQIYRSLDPRGAFPGGNGAYEYLSYLVDAGPLRALRETGKFAQTPLNMDEAFPMAVQFEKETIIFYTGLSPLLSPEAAKLNEQVIVQEKEHLRRVVEARQKYLTSR